GRPIRYCLHSSTLLFLPTPSARRATGRRSVRGHQSAISTHALREEGDVPPAAKSRRPAGISTHALREEGDLTEIAALLEEILFLPTPSARRATGRQGGIISIDLFLPTPSARRATAGGYPAVRLGRISTHALREEGDAVLQGAGGAVEIISTHALREEGDIVWTPLHSVLLLFLPTPSARRATRHRSSPGLVEVISTHALREEGDASRLPVSGS